MRPTAPRSARLLLLAGILSASSALAQAAGPGAPPTPVTPTPAPTPAHSPTAPASPAAATAGAPGATPSLESIQNANGVERLRLEAQALAPLLTSPLARQFLAATASLPTVEPRQIQFIKEPRKYFTPAEVQAMPEDRRARLETRTFDENYYYFTGYGSPLIYGRVLDLAASSAADPPLGPLAGKRVMDIGYGTVGQLRLMASLGAHAVGMDPHPLLAALYREPMDQGPVPGHAGAPAGSVKLVSDYWPSEDSARAGAGSGFDLITSKNTLKMGYIHPSQSVDKSLLVDIRVDDAAYVKALFDALNPGGLVVIYNISPAPSKPGEKYKPWAEGTTPFPRAAWESAGFRVLAFDQVDDDAATRLFAAIGYPTAGKDGEKDLFAHYTIAQRPK